MIPDRFGEIYLRADSGFYDSDFMDYLEQNGIRYTIVVRPYPWIQMELVGLNYRDLGGGISVGEMRYIGIGWQAPRRMVVIREHERACKRRKKQPTLFELMGYRYQVIVTNIDIEQMKPEEVWRFYNGWANLENMIKEGIMSYSLDVNISYFYRANVAHFHLVMLTYNMMNLFKEHVLGQKNKKRMDKWTRQRFFLIAGKLINSGRRFILELQEDLAYKEEYKNAERRLEALAWVT